MKSFVHQYCPPSGIELFQFPLLVSGTVYPSTSFPQDSSLHFLSQSLTVYSACAVTVVILDTLIVRVSYLLTMCAVYCVVATALGVDVRW